MLRVHQGHFLQRINRNLLRCIDDIVKNVRIVERFARPIAARRRGPRKPLALAALAALHDSLQELAVEEAKLRRHCIVSGVDNDFLDRQAQGSDQSCSSVRMLPFLGTNPQVAQGPCLVWRILLEPDGTGKKKKKKKRWPPTLHCRVDCHVPSFSLHAQTSSLVKLYTQPMVRVVVDVAIVSPLASSEHWLHDKAHQFDCLCYHTVLLWFFGRKYELVFYSLTYIKWVCMTTFFLPQDGVKTPSSTKLLRELLETPKWLWW
jgi:hypothetical protein